MKKNILLTGATGSVGSEALRELIRRKDRYQIRLFCLDLPNERKILSRYLDQVDTVWGDLRNPVDVNRAVAGVDVILHTAAIIPPLADQNPDLAYDVNVCGTKNLIAAAKNKNQPPKLVFTSSISVYGDRLSKPYIHVGDPLQPSLGDEYARTKILAEGLIQASGLRWSIFRLCGILTPKLKIQPLMFHMPLETALEWCHNSDAGLALVNAIECEALNGRIFNLGGGESNRITARAFLQHMLPLFGVNPRAVPDYAFATRNFHSGYYADGKDLNQLLSFQRKSLSDYFAFVRGNIFPAQTYLTRLLPNAWVRSYFERMSEPLKAIRENNHELVQRFYGSREAFERIFAQQMQKAGKRIAA